MKTFTRSLMCIICLLAFGTVSAQLANGSYVPNFTGTDLDGNSHTLYDYLDDGKMVVLDFSATWCPPCWAYHTSGALEDLYTQYGPSGTDQLMVFYIESDNSTGLADLQGSTSGSMGDWISGTDYPIIDNASLTAGFSISAYPTIYGICPDRKLIAQGQISATAWFSELSNCKVASAPLDMTIVEVAGKADNCNGQAELEVQVLNYGTNSLTSATIEVKNAAGTLISTTPWTGNLATYQSETISIAPYTLNGAEDLTIELIVLGDANTADNVATQTVGSYLADGTTVTLTLVNDANAAETSWEFVENSFGLNIASGSGYSNNSTITETFTINSVGCYEFTIRDTGGNGTGSYTLTDAQGNVIVTGSNFGSKANTPIKMGDPNAIDQPEFANSLELFPNPATDLLNVQLELSNATELNIAVTNTLGQVVDASFSGNVSEGKQNFEINTSKLNSGAYFLSIQTTEGIVSKRFVVNK